MYLLDWVAYFFWMIPLSLGTWFLMWWLYEIFDDYFNGGE